ncbi:MULTISPECIES: histidinol-phosphate transaminase [unclassified Campylobacter]|uniref:histidinol-phosphate transaminase n=1 Tax=unclassified Campylobacter TaxID=2593542 RepID=UPI001237F782|nr:MULTISPECIES: histidinol-phosphate transaminase [unclassified Campylobacter]KAA6226029.1 histidinol-phosphate transaminase [Campylobacter sp. LR196d]KAA6226622.1 histidinol-phosphate transaminase [Campylobacter sp. LR286c]KAA6229992.1 histidinol-phosphate transaminase [Campylobacter sp. LR291e]KAA6230835.1 histidinol-phosphate transaminase [Campylobacter sp. LR264d]
MKFNAVLDNIATYEPGKDIEVIAKEYRLSEVIKLASNENPYGTSSKVIESLQANANKANRYPDDSMAELKQALSAKFCINENELIIGAGSDQIIEFAVHAKLNDEHACLQSGVSFAMYQIYAKQVGAKCYKTKSIEHNLKNFKHLYKKHKDKVKIIFLCVPNNPLGECLDSVAIRKFIRKVDKDCLVVLDAAYNEFASFKDKNKELKPKALIEEFDNVLYLGTFSKLYGLGGLRVGYGIANEKIIKALYKLRPPFNVTNLSLKAAVAALTDNEFTQKTLQNNLDEMKKFEDFAIQNSIEFIPSYTNFITYLFKDKKNSTLIAENLLKKGIIIRNLKSYGLNAVRITIGTPLENAKFFDEFAKILQEDS